jgi:hypothetical protein
LANARTGKRFPLQLPITIQSTTAGKHSGTTANVSAAGVYLEADTKLTIGSPVRFDIRLPKDVLGTKTDVTIRCTGRVVRKEDSKEKGKSGLACVIDEYTFKRGGK